MSSWSQDRAQLTLVKVKTSSTAAPSDQPRRPLPLDWRNILLLGLVHLVTFGGLAIYLPTHGLSLAAALMGTLGAALTIFSVSAGYHRLFSHRAYQAHPALRFFLLVFGAGAFQNTALQWAADHRRHHGRTDTDLDPYNVRRGFWHAHIGWVLRKPDPEIKPASVRDLERDPLIVWQDRYYALIGLASGVALPVGLGFLFGDPWGGFIVGSAVRLFLVYHATFSINSFAHLIGDQPFSDRNSSRDSFLTALISMGEGYHNFHHTFPADYRNGAGTFCWDPTKWIISSLTVVGLARNLQRTPQPVILRARLRMDERRLLSAMVPPAAQERLQQLRAAIDRAVARWHTVVDRYEANKTLATNQARDVLASLRRETSLASRELQQAYLHWQRAVRSPASLCRAAVRPVV
jgi:stearoyl-CoA desaturase (delta-9 desaturase)